MPATAHVRDQLADVRTRTLELRDRLARAKADRDRAREAFAHSADLGEDSPEFRRAGLAVDAVHRIERELAMVTDEERFLLSQAAGMDGGAVYADSFTRDPEMLESLQRMATTSAPVGRVQLGAFADRERVARMTGQALIGLVADTVPTDRSREGSHRGIVPALQQPLSFLDLVPTEPMEGSSVPYAQEQGDPAGAAAVVAEGALKPQALITYEDAEARARTIAHFVKVRKQTLADVAQLETTLRDRLMYGVLRALERQVISGDGVGENMTGILHTAGIAAPDVSAIDLGADKTLEGLVSVLISGAVPNVIALSPRDWANMLTAKASTSGDYFSGGPFIATAQRLWSTPVVPCLGVPVGTALVGDTRLGCTLFVREGVSVTVSDSDSDDFTRNRLTLLGEGRWALAIWQPAAFAAVDLTTGP